MGLVVCIHERRRDMPFRHQGTRQPRLGLQLPEQPFNRDGIGLALDIEDHVGSKTFGQQHFGCQSAIGGNGLGFF